MKKDNLTSFEGILSFMGGGGKLKSLEKKLTSKSTPKDILKLITQCEKLVQELSGVDSDLLEQIISKIKKLRIMLLNIFKREKQKRINEHWQKQQKENIRFSKKIREELEEFSFTLSAEKNH